MSLSVWEILLRKKNKERNRLPLGGVSSRASLDLTAGGVRIGGWLLESAQDHPWSIREAIIHKQEDRVKDQ